MFDNSTSQLSDPKNQTAISTGSGSFVNDQSRSRLAGASVGPDLINKQGQVEDIFANSEKILGADRGAGFKVKTSNSLVSAGRKFQSGPSNDASLLSDRQTRIFSQSADKVSAERKTETDEIEFVTSSGSAKKKYFVIGLAGLVLIGGAAAYLVLGPGLRLFAPAESPNTDFQAAVPIPAAADTDTASDSNLEPVPEPAAVDQNSQQPVDLPPVVPAEGANDSDQDGLSDSDERALGINPANPDTDADGLFDLEEIKVYLTNPADSDTDGDGYLDGEEVSNGFDPKGPGRLLPDIVN